MTNNTDLHILLTSLEKQYNMRDRDIQVRQRFLHTNATDHTLDLLPLAQELQGLKDANRGLNLAIQEVRAMLEGYHLCNVQVLTTDFDFAMATPGQNGKCKLVSGHEGNHDVRNRP